ncbi:hypothetical protein CAC42_987 [Sphaceloma murrayae]|uniref:Cryptic loci regulator 2 N-terminal domain-containing protein n=1 Tax=Sphaceloma murrayae TaxID=2082308 RepID=A0A2K1R2V4_9PEZI|nr:hypothetical protein CAC42_987 [Sphaceloma murrayae]
MVASSVRRDVIPVCSSSDGLQSEWPERGFSEEDPSLYLSKLADKWTTETGLAVNGRKYTFDRLPSGYRLFGKRRGADPKHVDRYLYGNPKAKFRSVEEFYPHFKLLMEGSSLDGCSCVACTGRTKAKKKPQATEKKVFRSSKSVAQSSATASHMQIPVESPLQSRSYQTLYKTRPSTPEYEKVDEEGTPDVYRLLTDELSKRQVMDESILEPKSFDWRINRKQVQGFFKDIGKKSAFQPRLGEIVLFVRGLGPAQIIVYENERRSYAVWDTKQEMLIEMPRWEAGVVTEVPRESISEGDLVQEQRKQYQVNYSGYRIEPLPSIGQDEKHWSKRAVHVRLHEIRPFFLYREVQKNIRPANYHPTIGHALTAMSSFCLLERYHFKGIWPSASIFCRGIYIGAELIVCGDTVRLLPSGLSPGTSQVWDVVKITAIKLKLIHLDARENPDYYDYTRKTSDLGREYDCCVHIEGVGFTMDQSRAWGMGKLALVKDDVDIPAIIHGYGDWYRLHDPAKRWKVPFSKVLGRCVEAEAMKLWFSSVAGGSQLPASQGFAPINVPTSVPDSVVPETAVDISKGFKDMTTARKFAKARDPRLADSKHKEWFWADHRSEQLDLQEVKGQAVQDYVHGRPTRDVDAWRRALSIREKGAGHKAKLDPMSYVPGRPSSLSASLIAASAVGSAVDKSETDAAEGDTDDEIDDEVLAMPMDGARAEMAPAAESGQKPSTHQVPHQVPQQPMIRAEDIDMVSDGDESSEAESEEED